MFNYVWGGCRCCIEVQSVTTMMMRTCLLVPLLSQWRSQETTQLGPTSLWSTTQRKKCFPHIGLGGCQIDTLFGCILAVAWLLPFWPLIVHLDTSGALCCWQEHVFVILHMWSNCVDAVSGRQIVYMKMTTNTFREEAWIYHTEVAENIHTAFTASFGAMPLAWQDRLQQTQSKGKGRGRGKGYPSQWQSELHSEWQWAWTATRGWASVLCSNLQAASLLASASQWSRPGRVVRCRTTFYTCITDVTGVRCLVSRVSLVHSAHVMRVATSEKMQVTAQQSHDMRHCSHVWQLACKSN